MRRGALGAEDSSHLWRLVSGIGAIGFGVGFGIGQIGFGSVLGSVSGQIGFGLGGAGRSDSGSGAAIVADKSRVFAIALAECCEACAAVEIAGALGACAPADVEGVLALGVRLKDVLSRLIR